MRPKRRGFTLIELLVVISIIGVLSAGAASMFTNSQRRARDGRRRVDVKAIQNAAEQYYTTCGAYPASIADFDNATTGCAAGSGVSQFLQFGGGNAFPDDPRGNVDYRIVSATTASYQVCTDLELTATGAVDTWTAVNTDDADFCVSNLQ